jgi:RNA polymerase sigma-70 factor (ECF subfamily)
MLDNTEDLYFINSSVNNAELFADSHQQTSEIVSSIKKLDIGQRKPFEMHIAGFKYKEIADHMNISIGTVKSRIFFTRKKLMVTLKEYEN